MRSLFPLFSIISLFLLMNSCVSENTPEIKSEQDVLVLTLDNFEYALKKYDNLLVLFYVPYCSHCKQFLPEYEKVAPSLLNEDLHIAKLECDHQGKLCTQYNIRSYPTLKIFKKGKPEDYLGEKKIDPVIEWFKEQALPDYYQLEEIKELQRFKNRNELSVVYLGKNEGGIQNFISISQKYKKIPFGIASFDQAKIDYAENVKENDAIIIFKEFFNERPILELTEKIGIKEMEKFIKDNTDHQVLPYNGQIGYILFHRRFPGIIIFGEKNSEKWFDYQNMLGNILNTVGDKMKVIMADINDHDGDQLMEMLNVKRRDVPCVKIVEAKRNRKYLLQDEITEENLLKFYQEWIAGNLKPDLKSEREPTEKYENGVRVVVTNTFENDVLKNDNDVFVMYYSSVKWNCKEFVPKFEELANKLKENNKKLEFAKVDLVLNEIDGLIVKLVPNLKLYKGNQKNSDPIDYKGDKSFDDMVKFLKENSFHTIVYEDKKNEKVGDL